MAAILEKNIDTSIIDIPKKPISVSNSQEMPGLHPKGPGSLQLSGGFLQERSIDENATFMDDQGIIQKKEDYVPLLEDSEYVAHPDGEGLLEFQLPEYGYAQYINDMSAWQKQIR